MGSGDTADVFGLTFGDMGEASALALLKAGMDPSKNLRHKFNILLAMESYPFPHMRSQLTLYLSTRGIPFCRSFDYPSYLNV